MQLIVVSGLIAILASVSADCDVGKTVNDFDFNKIITFMAVCRDCNFESPSVLWMCVSFEVRVLFR